jgi:hypothetical protein
MKLIQKPCKFVGQHREDGIVAQLSCITKPDSSIIKGIESFTLATAANQGMHNMTPNLSKYNKINDDNEHNCNNVNKSDKQIDNDHLGSLPYIQFELTGTRQAWAPYMICPLAVFSFPRSMRSRLVSFFAAASGIFSGKNNQNNRRIIENNRQNNTHNRTIMHIILVLLNHIKSIS